MEMKRRILLIRRKSIKKHLCILAVFLFSNTMKTSAQDPSFSQFFSSPLNINPALTGNINGEWRAISNFRSQYAGPAYPYRTGTVSFDAKILPDRIPEDHTFGIGTMFMYDKAMDGILKATYASLNFSYNHIPHKDEVCAAAQHRSSAILAAWRHYNMQGPRRSVACILQQTDPGIIKSLREYFGCFRILIQPH